jgi:hypothetical protein
MRDLCEKYFGPGDVRDVQSRKIGGGYIGGKALGMLLARRMLQKNAPVALQRRIEPHISFYIGTDVYEDWQERGEKFSPLQKGELERALERLGEGPIIVRSSSILEDNFGNAFAGKYESVFLANSGPAHERARAFIEAAAAVYRSCRSEEARRYRENRGLQNADEKMALLAQRVSGSERGGLFYPDVAGVGYSTNLYVWERGIDPAAGMLRLVCGLGTRAVDRVPGDFARVVSLHDPARRPIAPEDEAKYAQRRADVINLATRRLEDRPVSELDLANFPGWERLLTKTAELPSVMRTVLTGLAAAYDYPVDIEFTVNFNAAGGFTVNLLQCRPLETMKSAAGAEAPEAPSNPLGGSEPLLSCNGGFMGGNTRRGIDKVIYVPAKAYLALPERDKYQVARVIGALNTCLRGQKVLLIGPGRWGSTTPSLGVPAHFSELCHMTALAEVSYSEGGFAPELSFGSHFFADLVESGMFYAAVYPEREETVFAPDMITSRENLLLSLLPDSAALAEVIHVASTEGLVFYANMLSQKLLVFFS